MVWPHERRALAHLKENIPSWVRCSDVPQGTFTFSIMRRAAKTARPLFAKCVDKPKFMTHFNQKTKTKTIVLTERERFKNSICFDWHPASTRHSSDWFCCRFHWSSVPSQSCVTNHPALSVSRSRSVQPCSQQDLLALMSAQRCLSSHPSPDLQCLCLDCAGSHSCCWLSELLINVSSVLPPRSISSLSESNHLICIKKNLTLGMLWRQRNS